MAVYQISRIQVRRGQANQGTGLPQLASGEMAWAIDTQQLFIGSGAVSEGAPGVSNIRIVTEQDLGLEGNLLGLVQYVYGSNNAAITTGPNANTPISRSITNRLDDQITTVDFGTVGDGIADDTAALQRAINQLFLNPSNPANLSTATNTRVTLTIPPGIYKTTSTIYIPSYSTIVGAGIDKTIINFVPTQTNFTVAITINNAIVPMTSAVSSMQNQIVTCSVAGIIPPNTYISTVNPGVSVTLSNLPLVSTPSTVITLTVPSPAIQFVNDSSSPGNPDPSIANSTNQSRKIQLSNLNIETYTGLNTAMLLNSVRDSLFENICLIGGYTNLTNTNSIGMHMTAVSGGPSGTSCEHNVFRCIQFGRSGSTSTSGGFTYDVFAKDDILNNIFENCYLTNSLQGFCLGLGGAITLANPNGPRQTEIINSKFNNIQQEAVYVATGTGNVTRDCKYIGVGNNGGTNGVSQYPQVYFATYGNLDFNSQSDRSADLSAPSGTYGTVPYVPEVTGHIIYSAFGTKTISISQTSVYVPVLKLPIPWLPLTTDRTTGPSGASIVYVIDYFYSSQNHFTRRGTITISADPADKMIQLTDDYDFAGSDAGDTIATYLDFQAQYVDNTGTVTITNPWSIVISYVNNISDSGVFTYTYRSIS
jgi:hypothetical protein